MLILLSQRALWRCELSVHFSIESPWHKFDTGSRSYPGSEWTRRGCEPPSSWAGSLSRWCSSSPCPPAGGLQTGTSPLGLAQW